MTFLGVPIPAFVISDQTQEWLTGHRDLYDGMKETSMKTRTYFDVRFDVTDLDQSERDALVGEVVAQSDRSEGHPSVEVETEWNEVEVEDEREVLVHLHVSFPSSYDVTDETVAKAILDAYGVGAEGGLSLYADMKVVVALAETVS